MKEFPTAAEMAKLTPEDLALWDMEHELKCIKRQMFESIRLGLEYLVRFHMLESTIEFLRDHGYSVELRNGTDYYITWDKVFQCGGVVKYDVLCNSEDKNIVNCTNGVLNEDMFNQFKKSEKIYNSKNLTF